MEVGWGDELLLCRGNPRELRYYPWGEVRWSSGTTPTDYRFTGQMEVASIGLYFFNARWYDAGIGRFIQADNIIPNPYRPASFDRFSYVLNSPLRYIDPSGRHYCDSPLADPEDCEGINKNPLSLPSTPPEGLLDDGQEAYAGLSNLNAIAIANGITMSAQDWLAFVIVTEFLGAHGADQDIIEAMTRRYHEYCSGGAWSASCFNGFWGYMQAFHSGGDIDALLNWVISPDEAHVNNWDIAIQIAYAIRHPNEVNDFGITASMNECYGHRCDWVTISDPANGSLSDENSLFHHIDELFRGSHHGWLIYPEGADYFLVLTVSQVQSLCPGGGNCNLTGVTIDP